MLLCLLVLLSVAFAQEICSSTSVGLQGGVDDYGKLQPQKVLYINIVGPSRNYESNMKMGYTMLARVLQDTYPTSTAIYMTCTVNDCSADLTGYTQIWVTDLSSEFDLNPNQLKMYKAIASWYVGKDRPPLIADGRLLSSLWPSPVNGGCCTNYGYNYPNGRDRPNPRLMENYFVSLALRGGGLMLGTDHNAFTDGINEVMKNCGFNEFYGNYYSNPLIMEIDEKSTVMNFPKDASEEIGGWSTSVRKFLWDDSSTAYSPISEQPNGLVLYPIGWHGTGELSPGISTTIRGSVGFLIDITTPTCGQIFKQGTVVTLTANIVKPGTAPYVWEWTSSVSGLLGKAATISVALAPGRHILTVRVKDSQRFVATAWVSVTMVYETGNAECLIFSRNNTEVLEYFPLQRKDGMSAVDYYSYTGGRSHTYDKIEDQVPLSLNMALFDDNRGSLSLIFIASDNAQITTTKIVLSMTQGRKVDGRLVPVQVTLRDDPGDIGFIWTPQTLSGAVAWTYQKTTKGFILGNLPHEFMDRWCVDLTFDHASSRSVNWVNVFGHPKNSTTWPSPWRIDTYQYAEPQTKTISFCRAQCGCPAQEVRTNYWGFIEPIMVNTGNPGNVNTKYNDKTSCTWSIQPRRTTLKRDENEVEQLLKPEGIAFHWDGPFDVKPGDSVSLLAFDAAGNSRTVWTASGRTAPAVALFKTTRLDIAFHTNGDGNAGAGWTFHYYAMPSIFSVVPKMGPTVDKTKCLITGAFFIDSPAMGARLIFPNGSAFKLPVRYISETQIEVVMPQSRPMVAVIQVSNDNHAGHDFWTEKTNITYEWFDATCTQTKTCAGCAQRASDGCAWCNNLNNPGLSFCFPTAENSCPRTELFKTDSACCTVCGPLGKCHGGGACQCNETCKCDAKHWAADCHCLTCPAGVGKPVNGPANFNCSGHGTCGCDGQCACARGYRGKACECKVCEGNPTTCSGNGNCECDGTCTCNAGWTNSIPEKKVCDCSTECPANCSGHGTCKCGVCECDAGFGSQPDCGCIDECPVKCNKQQVCQCNGTCACLPGFHGDDCSTKSQCGNITDCTACMGTQDCGWCDDANVCENVFSPQKCGRDDFQNPRGFVFVDVCVIGGLDQKDVESENRGSVLMAALVGTVLAAGLAMAAAAALMRAAPVLPPGFSGLGDGAGSAYQESAIYEAQTNVGVQ